MDIPAPGRTICTVTKPTHHAATAVTCGVGRSGTPSQNTGTGELTANTVAAAAAGPTAFDPARYARRNQVERLINRLKISRAVATRFDERAYVFHGTAAHAAPRLWLRS